MRVKRTNDINEYSVIRPVTICVFKDRYVCLILICTRPREIQTLWVMNVYWIFFSLGLAHREQQCTTADKKSERLSLSAREWEEGCYLISRHNLFFLNHPTVTRRVYSNVIFAFYPDSPSQRKAGAKKKKNVIAKDKKKKRKYFNIPLEKRTTTLFCGAVFYCPRVCRLILC